MQQDCQGGQPAACVALAYLVRQDPSVVDGNVDPSALLNEGKRLMCSAPAARRDAPAKPRASEEAEVEAKVKAWRGKVSQVPAPTVEDEARVKEARLAWVAKPTAPMSETLDLRVLAKNFGIDPAHFGKMAIPVVSLDSFRRTDWLTMATSLGMPDSVEYQQFFNRLQGALVTATSRYSEWVAKEGLGETKKDEMVEQAALLQRWTQVLRRQVDQIATWRRSR